MMKYCFGKELFGDIDRSLSLEWIETNGLGGWASSSVPCVNTRRYHGMLVSALRPPVGRAVLVSRVDETIIDAGRRYALGCGEMEDGSVVPQAWKCLERFEKNLFPTFEYQAGECRLKKTIAMCHGCDMTLLLYEVLEANGPIELELTPLFAGRDYHYETRADDSATMGCRFEGHELRVACGPGSTDAFVSVPGATFVGKSAWIRGIKHRMEEYRGLGDLEDLFRCGMLTVQLRAGDRLGVILSTQSCAEQDAWALFEQERMRREALVVSGRNDLEQTLLLAADQFVVARGADLQTIIAGYHWFTDWGRDSMISLSGLCLCTGRFDVARKIIQAFADHVSEGMIPNRFPDGGDEPEYNTVDATLWMFSAIYEYLAHTDDEAFVQALYPTLKDIIEWHKNGTRYHIEICEDGLISAGEHGTQLTWMDAKVGDWVVTPRQGKAVEINALWYNALMIMSSLSERYGHSEDRSVFFRMAERVKEVFLSVFWNEQTGCLFDCVDGGRKDAAIRPNQLFAICLAFPLLEEEHSIQVLKVVEEKLVTPVGLRSLASDDPQYHGWYGGDQVSRDGAYHQGTVWSWLAGPYIRAVYKVFDKPQADVMCGRLIDGLQAHLTEAGVGSISEVFDGDAPHAPRGCMSQAWGVAEFLRVYREFVN